MTEKEMHCRREQPRHTRRGKALSPLLALLLVAVGLCPPVASANGGGPAISLLPVQTYFVPLPEDELLNDTFETINSIAAGPVNSLISIAISADGTVVYYDQWEDGYEADVTSPGQLTTQVWGDGLASNGCSPNIILCTDLADILNGGDTIVLENPVPSPRGSDILFDGRDRIQASFPIAVTRGAFPDIPGSLLAGAVEVLDTDAWGTEFVSPVGEDTPGSSFEYSALYVMAREDATTVTLPDSTTATLNQGEDLLVRVNEGDALSADSPVQVHLVTGDIGSRYELRWYSLIPLADWANDYYTPVGDSVGGTGNVGPTRVWLFNPNVSALTVSYDFLPAGAGSEDGSVSVPAGGTAESPPIPDGSGARFSAESAFFALTQTDTEGEGTNTNGEVSDWGHPLIPADQLTSQALIGWGYGCTNNNCNQSTSISTTSRSVVWVTPVANATLNIDFDGDGVVDSTIAASALESVKITDPSDEDMTGALIFARNAANDVGTEIAIAVAWGQDPELSASADSGALDLGTTVPPLPILEAGKSAELLVDADADGEFSTGDTVLYTIRVVNIGQVDLPAGSWNLLDFAVPVGTTYVPESTQYDDGTTITDIADDTTPTAFPLDDPGLDSIAVLPARGGVHEVSFEATIDLVGDAACPDTIINSGLIRVAGPGETLDEFEVETPINCDEPAIEILKTPDLQQVVSGTTVTFDIEVTNTGNVDLVNVAVTDALAPNCDNVIGDLAAGASTSYQCTLANVTVGFINVAVVTGDPPAGPPVTDEDPAEVDVIDPAIEILKTPDLQQVVSGDTVTFVIQVTNTGDVDLANVTVTDALAPNCNNTIGALAVGAVVSYQCTLDNVTADFTNVAEVTGEPPVGPPVTDDDPADVEVINPAIEILKTPDLQQVASGETVTFDILVTNTGDVDLVNVIVTDALAPDCNNAIGDLAAGASVGYQCTLANVTADFTNVAEVTGDPPVGPPVTDDDPADVEVLAGGGQGCTPGYWKQPHHFDSWVAYTPNQLFSDVFEDAFPGKTLLGVLRQGGGGLKALGRHTVAALLNASNAGVSYDLSAAGVIDAFNTVYPSSKQQYNAVKDGFEDFNEQGCPLN